MGGADAGSEEERRALQERWRRIAELYEIASLLLAGLDALQLHQAGAHLTPAMRAIRQEHPELASIAEAYPPDASA
jgi:hypothetical protein